MPDESVVETTNEQKILDLAHERFATIQTAEQHIRDASLEDIKFTYNIDEGQWPEAIRTERELDGRPCLTSNKLRKFVAVVANQERENRIAVKVRPVDDAADPVRAMIYEDLVRQIEFSSSADEVYSDAGEQAAAGGFGYWRILTELPEDGFNQEIFIKHIKNQFSVYMDPRRNFCFISDWMSRREFEAEFPGVEMVGFEQQGPGENWEGWYEPDKVRVAEYYTKEHVTRKLIQFKDPTTGEIGVTEEKDGVTEQTLAARGFEVTQTREAEGHKVRWYKISGHKILDERDVPSKEIPVVEVLGDEVNVEGKTYKRSLIRDGKDPQRMYNYWLTTETETIALAPKAPYLVTAQEIAGHENMWDDANRKNLPFLKYNSTGNNVPKREAPPQVSSGHMNMMNVANADIKDTLGMFESFLGEASNERSGRAIFARQQRSQVGTLHFPDNLRRAVIQTGKILIDMIPRVYDAERVVRIRGEEGGETTIRLNYTQKDDVGNTIIGDDGNPIIFNDLSVGKYDVRADVRLYSTRRQESVEVMLQAMQYTPQMAPFFVDLLFKFMDAPGADEIKARVEKFIQSQQGQPDGGGGRNGTGGAGGPVPSASLNAGEANGI